MLTTYPSLFFDAAQKPSLAFLRRFTGYVEQFDTLIGSLTVKEMVSIGTIEPRFSHLALDGMPGSDSDQFGQHPGFVTGVTMLAELFETAKEQSSTVSIAPFVSFRTHAMVLQVQY